LKMMVQFCENTKELWKIMRVWVGDSPFQRWLSKASLSTERLLCVFAVVLATQVPQSRMPLARQYALAKPACILRDPDVWIWSEKEKCVHVFRALLQSLGLCSLWFSL
jgi:hypothetical protein